MAPLLTGCRAAFPPFLSPMPICLVSARLPGNRGEDSEPAAPGGGRGGARRGGGGDALEGRGGRSGSGGDPGTHAEQMAAPGRGRRASGERGSQSVPAAARERANECKQAGCHVTPPPSPYPLSRGPYFAAEDAISFG